MLDSLQDCKKTIGVKQTLKAVQKGKIKTVYIARDADIRVTAELCRLCEQNDIPVLYADTMKQLGKDCSIDVGASTVGIIIQ